MNWPSVANGDPTIDAWDTHAANFGPLRNLHCPKLDSGFRRCFEDLDQRGLLKETLVVAIGEFGRSPRLGVSTSGNGNAPDGRDHWPYCYTALVAGAGIQPRRALRQIRCDRVFAGGEPGASDATPGDDLSRARHRSAHDRLQSSESTARTGAGRAGTRIVQLMPPVNSGFDNPLGIPSSRAGWLRLLLLAVLPCCGFAAFAQPKITSLSADWIQRGAILTVTIAGEKLGSVTVLLFSGEAGLSATIVVETSPPPSITVESAAKSIAAATTAPGRTG